MDYACIAKSFMDLFFHLVKRFTVCCFFCKRVQINLNGDLLWFGVSPREVLVKLTYRGGGDWLYQWPAMVIKCINVLLWWLTVSMSCYGDSLYQCPAMVINCSNGLLWWLTVSMSCYGDLLYQCPAMVINCINGLPWWLTVSMFCYGD